MKFGEVLDYRDIEEAKKYLGRRGVFSDILKIITERPIQCLEGTLEKVDEEDLYPFCGIGIDIYQYFRPLLEEEQPMTNRQLAEWLVKGHGEYCFSNGSMVFSTFTYDELTENDPVDKNTFIRHWDETEWVSPTRGIYEKDCSAYDRH